MPVLIEGISVVVRRDAIGRSFVGGWHGFLQLVPNQTLCYDDELARVGFMNPSDVGEFVAALERGGMQFVVDSEARDLAVVDQRTGPTTTVRWLRVRTVESFELGGKIQICELVGGTAGAPSQPGFEVALPPQWRYAGSLSESHVYVPRPEASGRLLHLRNDGQVESYVDFASGKVVFAGRTGRADPSGSVEGVRPEIVAAHNLLKEMDHEVSTYLRLRDAVFARGVRLILRILRLVREPDYQAIAREVKIQERRLYGIRGRWLLTVQSGGKLGQLRLDVDHLLEQLLAAASALEALLVDTARTGKAANASEALLVNFQFVDNLLGEELRKVSDKYPGVIFYPTT